MHVACSIFCFLFQKKTFHSIPPLHYYKACTVKKGIIKYRRMYSTTPSYEHLLINPNEDGIDEAAKLLSSGSIVGFPTETVYGLGANALNVDAVNAVFVAKGRPLTDPLIVHILNYSAALPLVRLSEDEEEVFKSLTSKFWPGPLTLIVQASNLIPSAVTANTGYVGVRCPAHPIARRLLDKCNLPIAAPSANRFGHVSPTKAVHVLADLGMKGVRVLNGEAQVDDCGVTNEESSCEYGIESTVLKIDGSCKTLFLFRQGVINQQQIEAHISSSWTIKVISRAVIMAHTPLEVASIPTTASIGQEAPGQAICHYSPDVPCCIVRSVISSATTVSLPSTFNVLTLSKEDMRTSCVIVDYNSTLSHLSDKVLAYRDLSSTGQPSEAAHVLFDTLRWAESILGARRVLLASIPSPIEITNNPGVTLGVADRVYRAASGVIVDLIVT